MLPSLSATYKKYENIKRPAYGQQIRDASFIPLVMSAGLAFLFHCCDLPLLASAVLSRHLVITTELHPQWIL